MKFSDIKEFDDIKIVSLDESASGPSGEGALMTMVLRLSGKAPSAWCAYFNAGWKSNFFMMKRRAEANGTSIVVTCLPDELQDQINHMKPIVAQSNAAYKELLAEHQAAQDAANKDAQDRKETLKNLKGSLDFD